MIRICPKRDGKCPHGMSCPYTIDRYTCKDETTTANIREKLAAVIAALTGSNE